MANVQKVHTCLWFDTQGEDAARFYTSLFPNSRMIHVSHYPANAPMPEGTPMLIRFVLGGTEFSALNGGKHFKLTEASSLVAVCDDQAELDRLWSQLTADGGAPSECGWLKDRFGVSWQLWPAGLAEMLADPDKAAVNRVLQAVWKMKKLDMATLGKAYRGT